LKYLWKAVNQIDFIFEIKSKRISDKRYEVKYEILNENGESIEFAIEIYENAEKCLEIILKDISFNIISKHFSAFS